MSVVYCWTRKKKSYVDACRGLFISEWIALIRACVYRFRHRFYFCMYIMRNLFACRIFIFSLTLFLDFLLDSFEIWVILLPLERLFLGVFYTLHRENIISFSRKFFSILLCFNIAGIDSRVYLAKKHSKFRQQHRKFFLQYYTLHERNLLNFFPHKFSFQFCNVFSNKLSVKFCLLKIQISASTLARWNWFLSLSRRKYFLPTKSSKDDWINK